MRECESECESESESERKRTIDETPTPLRRSINRGSVFSPAMALVDIAPEVIYGIANSRCKDGMS